MPVRVQKDSAARHPNGARLAKNAGRNNRHPTNRLGLIPSVEEPELFNVFFKNLVSEVRRTSRAVGEHEARLNGFRVDPGTSEVTYDNGGV